MSLLATVAVACNTFLTPTLTGRAIECEASWYGREHRGKVTASGEKFDDREYTCATWFYPLGTDLVVTNIKTGKAVRVRVNDRGPSWDLVFKKTRCIDLTHAAFKRIANPSEGLCWVKVETFERWNLTSTTVLINYAPVR